MESSRRDVLKYVAEHRFIVMNVQNAYYPCFTSTFKTGKDSHKQVYRFYYEITYDQFALVSQAFKNLISYRKPAPCLKGRLRADRLT